MQSSFLRLREFNYKDVYEKALPEEEAPSKFQKEVDNYVKRVIRERPKPKSVAEPVVQSLPPSPLPQVQEQQQSPLCAFCSRLFEEKPHHICVNCVNKLCEKCIKHPDTAKQCKCKEILCQQCRKALGLGPTLSLKSYPIRLKQMDQLHFEDCKCEICEAQR